MRAMEAYTEEIDDLDAAAEALLEQTEDFVLAKNSMAILFAEEDTDYRALYTRLARYWDFPVMGCTSMAMLSGRKGYCRSGVSVLLLTADDCEFSVGTTGELDRGTYREQIAQLYHELAAQHTSEIKLGLSYLGFDVKEQELSGGNLLAALDDAVDGLPIYGGAASDNLSFTGYRVFYNEREIKNGVVLALISGNVSPRFVRINSVDHTASFSYEMTKTAGSVVLRLGNDTFVDALKKENMRVDQEDMMAAYMLSPFVVTVDHGNGDKVQAARILAKLDLETGAGIFQGAMPEGATLGIGLLTREDVCRSVETAFTQMLRELSQPGDEHSVLLCTSCGARYLALMNAPASEAETYKGRLPEGLSLVGFYAYGECCPVQGTKTDKEYNMFHNFTFTILAL
ncbi:MAG: hypothetical protein E7425_00240 [Ruminococcaceae bacterium]|nr:hypothetical protein [Oscillospiraceae bacterium]